jgi:hypothetical protein
LNYEKEGKGRKTIKARELWEKNIRISNWNRHTIYAL